MAYEKEKRGTDLLEGRSITISGLNLPLPKTTGKSIPGGEVDSLMDLAHIVNLHNSNGNSYDAPYLVTQPKAVETAEGADATETEPGFGSQTINGSKITAYANISREARKLPLATYEETVSNEAGKALKRKIGEDMIAKIYASSKVKKVTAAAIDKDTLANVVYEIQRPEGVEGTATLVLTLSDLKAFAQVKQSGGRKVYDIIFNGVSGTIDGIPFLISSHVDDNSPVYGYFDAFQIVLFSDPEVRRSSAQGFRSRLDAYLADVVAGGEVVVPDCFVIVNK